MICCQCKKNQIDFKSWSVADLGDELLKAAQFLVDNQNSRVKFYSRSNFGALNKLREHSKTQPNEIAYKKSLTLQHQATDIEIRKSSYGDFTTYYVGRHLAVSEIIEPTKPSVYDLEIQKKIDAIELAEKLANVSETPRISGCSRETIYKNRRLLKEKGS